LQLTGVITAALGWADVRGVEAGAD